MLRWKRKYFTMCLLLFFVAFIGFAYVNDRNFNNFANVWEAAVENGAAWKKMISSYYVKLGEKNHITAADGTGPQLNPAPELDPAPQLNPPLFKEHEVRSRNNQLPPASESPKQLKPFKQKTINEEHVIRNKKGEFIGMKLFPFGVEGKAQNQGNLRQSDDSKEKVISKPNEAREVTSDFAKEGRISEVTNPEQGQHFLGDNPHSGIETGLLNDVESDRNLKHDLNDVQHNVLSALLHAKAQRALKADQSNTFINHEQQIDNAKRNHAIDQGGPVGNQRDYFLQRENEQPIAQKSENENRRRKEDLLQGAFQRHYLANSDDKVPQANEQGERRKPRPALGKENHALGKKFDLALYRKAVEHLLHQRDQERNEHLLEQANREQPVLDQRIKHKSHKSFGAVRQNLHEDAVYKNSGDKLGSDFVMKKDGPVLRGGSGLAARPFGKKGFNPFLNKFFGPKDNKFNNARKKERKRDRVVKRSAKYSNEFSNRNQHRRPNANGMWIHSASRSKYRDIERNGNESSFRKEKLFTLKHELMGYHKNNRTDYEGSSNINKHRRRGLFGTETKEIARILAPDDALTHAENHLENKKHFIQADANFSQETTQYRSLAFKKNGTKDHIPFNVTRNYELKHENNNFNSPDENTKTQTDNRQNSTKVQSKSNNDPDSGISTEDIRQPLNFQARCVQFRFPDNPGTLCIHREGEDPDVSDIIAETREYEPRMMKQLVHTLKKDPTLGLVDIGAGIGLHSLTAALMGRPVVAVEPFFKNVRLLHKSALINNVTDKIILVTNALGNSSYVGRLSYNHGQTRVSDIHISPLVPGMHVDPAYIVKKTTLNNLRQVVPFSRAVVKLDVDHRLTAAILENGREFFRQVYVPYIFTNWSDTNSMAQRFKLMTTLSKMGYMQDMTGPDLKGDNLLKASINHFRLWAKVY